MTTVLLRSQLQAEQECASGRGVAAHRLGWTSQTRLQKGISGRQLQDLCLSRTQVAPATAVLSAAHSHKVPLKAALQFPKLPTQASAAHVFGVRAGRSKILRIP